MQRSRVSTDMLVRVAADVISINICLFFSLVPEALLRNQSPLVVFHSLIVSALLLSLISPCIFYLSGFYTRGRSYRGKYKALVVVQGVAIAYLLAAVGMYFFRLRPSFPRSSFILGWITCSLCLVATRFWSTAWKHLVIRETRIDTVNVLDQKSILVIGGAGYVGSALLPKLLDRGYRVRLLDCFLYGEEPIRSFIGHANLEIHKGDFRNVDTVVAAMKGMRSVVHLGGLVGDPACALDEELTIQVNLIATRMIAQVAKGNGVSRVVFASSCSVYGASDQILDERSILAPVSLYARSKIASENVLLSLADDDFDPVILRFGTIYGLSGRTRFDLVVNLLVAKAMTDGVITVQGKDQWRPFVHVYDVGRAVLLALEAGSDAVAPRIFNVGSDEQNRTLGQIGELIRDMVPGSILSCTEENVDGRNYRVEFRRIRSALGFSPEWNLVSGINQVMVAIRTGEVVDYRQAQYSNVKCLSEPNTRKHYVVIEDWVPKFMPHRSSVVEAAFVPGQPD